MIELSIIAPALVAGLLVLVTHIPLGSEVLKREIIFIDLAVAQIAGLGVIVAAMLEWELHSWQTRGIALLFALAGAMLLGLVEKRLARQQEALIGITFILAATLGLLLLAHDPHGGEALKSLLTGQILWTNWSDLPELAVMSIIVLILYLRFHGHHRLWFYLLFAAAVTTSVQIVGVYLVFASLIIPAFFARLATYEQQRTVAFLIGAGGYLAGLLGSTWFDLPAGALIVWCLALCGLLALLYRKLSSSYKMDNHPLDDAREIEEKS